MCERETEMKSQLLRLESGHMYPKLSRKKFSLMKTCFGTKYRRATPDLHSSHHTSFLVFQQSHRHPASWHQVYGAEHTGSVECIAAALAQERSGGGGACGCVVSRKSEDGCARDGHFFGG